MRSRLRSPKRVRKGMLSMKSPRNAFILFILLAITYGAYSSYQSNGGLGKTILRNDPEVQKKEEKEQPQTAAKSLVQKMDTAIEATGTGSHEENVGKEEENLPKVDKPTSEKNQPTGMEPKNNDFSETKDSGDKKATDGKDSTKGAPSVDKVTSRANPPSSQTLDAAEQNKGASSMDQKDQPPAKPEDAKTVEQKGPAEANPAEREEKTLLQPGQRNSERYSAETQLSSNQNTAQKPNDVAAVTPLNDAEKLLSKVQQLEKSLERMQKRTAHVREYPEVPFLNYKQRKRILVTGGAGFVGSHLVDALMFQGHEVTVVDNFFTGRKQNVEHWIGHDNFELINHDIVMPIYLEVDQVYHLASPASPVHYMENPVKTIKCNTLGTINVLGLANRVNARVLFASTSEVYGDPAKEWHPQNETYHGNVNPIGPRACYDESKRVGETLCYSYQQQENVEVRVARIFNTFGPRMHMNDGRVVSNFILQALQGQKLSVYDGRQTRSFQYVSDLVAGLMALMNGDYSGPVNLGNPDEYTIGEFAELVVKLVGNPKASVNITNLPKDDPHRRKPDITLAKEKLGWQPEVKVLDGLQKTIAYFREELVKSRFISADSSAPPAGKETAPQNDRTPLSPGAPQSARTAFEAPSQVDKNPPTVKTVLNRGID